jgi:predicted N-formylglutamate amidohydrolase
MPLVSPDWPAPVEALNEGGTSDIVLLCEHASNHIPAAYGGLGLPPPDLLRHIAWDPGAAAVARALSARLDAAAFLGTYSRLLIDLNRPLAAPDSIVTRSEDTDVPGNAGLAPAERQRRADTIFTPYHARVAAHLGERGGRPTRLVTIHSFTPVFHGVARPWHAGVLFIAATGFGGEMVERLREPGLLVEANVPYKSDRAGDYAIPRHGDDRGIPAVLIELRNDLIVDPAGIAQWTARLARALGAD